VYDLQHRSPVREAPDVDRTPADVLDAELTAEVLTADRRGPEAVQGVLALLTAEQRQAAIALLQRERGNHHVAQTLGYGSSERDLYEANAASFDKKWDKDPLLARALARHRGEDVDAALAAQAPAAELGAPTAAEPAAPAVVAAAEPVAAPAPASASVAWSSTTAPAASSERDIYEANAASFDQKWANDPLLARALARRRGVNVDAALAAQAPVAELGAPTARAAEPAAPAAPAAAEESAAPAPAPVAWSSTTAPAASSERDIYEANAASFDKKWEKDSFLQRALARHRGEQADAPATAATVASAETTVAVIEQAEQAGLDEQGAAEVAREVEQEAVAVAAPEATVAPAPEVSARDAYLANRAAMDAKLSRDALFQRALARHRGEAVEPPLPGQQVEPAPASAEAKASAEATAAEGPVVTEAVTAPPTTEAPPAVADQAPADLSTTFAAAQAAPGASAREGIDSLNTEGSYDYRLGKVAQIRQDMLTGSMDAMSPDVSADVVADTVPHLDGITDEQMVAIQAYTSQDYLALNKVMRQPDADPEQTARLAGYVEAVRSGLDALPSYEGEVYRGTAMSQRLWAMWEQAAADGGTVSDAAFSSSSKDTEVAEDFLRKTRDPSKVSVYCRIQSRTGKQIEFLSRTANEAEVLFNSGAKFKILYIEDGVGPDGLPRKEVFLREVVDDRRSME